MPLNFVRLWDRADGKAGLFNLEEFNQRLDAVFSATTQSQLSTLICDLLRLAAPPAPLHLTADLRAATRSAPPPPASLRGITYLPSPHVGGRL